METNCVLILTLLKSKILVCIYILNDSFISFIYIFVIVRSILQEDAQIHEVHCSRERSRIAWKIIEEV